MMQESSHNESGTSPLIGIALLIAVYIISVVIGLPQKGTELVIEGKHHESHAADHSHEEHSGEEHHGGEKTTSEQGEQPAAESDPHSQASGASHPEEKAHPPYWSVIPFVILLLCIAVLPLIPATEHWWESNRNRFLVAAGLGILTLLYYLLINDLPVEGHWPAHYVANPSEGPLNWQVAWAVLANAFLAEYIPFIVLLFSLYTISGGIRIEGDLRAHPLTNTTFLAIGGLLASFIGTTGAAMLLIRPLLETNIERHNVRHTVIFFIFVVCNCGGCLLPIGDPPLFLGYLKGVDFFWTFNLWSEWLVVNCMLLAVYWIWDHFFSYPQEKVRDIVRDETQVRRLRIRGLGINGILLFGVILSVAFLDPSKALPGTDWHPWLYLREAVQLGLVGLSLLLGSQSIRKENRFNYHAIVEVAALFVGIFVCMQPALQILNIKGASLGIDTPQKFFWITGSLSAVLDNAPTYVVFFETAKTLGGTPAVAGVQENILIAISLGAVFMGAMTYIGNGPNFMVKAIAEKSGVPMPSFFGYIVYSVCILLPILFLAELFLF